MWLFAANKQRGSKQSGGCTHTHTQHTHRLDIRSGVIFRFGLRTRSEIDLVRRRPPSAAASGDGRGAHFSTEKLDFFPPSRPQDAAIRLQPALPSAGQGRRSKRRPWKIAMRAAAQAGSAPVVFVVVAVFTTQPPGYGGRIGGKSQQWQPTGQDRRLAVRGQRAIGDISNSSLTKTI